MANGFSFEKPIVYQKSIDFADTIRQAAAKITCGYGIRGRMSNPAIRRASERPLIIP